MVAPIACPVHIPLLRSLRSHFAQFAHWTASVAPTSTATAGSICCLAILRTRRYKVDLEISPLSREQPSGLRLTSRSVQTSKSPQDKYVLSTAALKFMTLLATGPRQAATSTGMATTTLLLVH